MKKILLIPVLLISFTICQAQKSALHLKLKNGEEYKQTSSAKSTVTQSVMGQQVEIVMTVSGDMSYIVKEITKEGYELDVIYRTLALNMEMPQGKMEFNSEKEGSADPISSALSQMKDKPFQVKMTKYGKVMEVRNLETIFDSVMSQFADMPAAQQQQVRDQLVKAYGEEAFKGNIEMITAIYPEQKVGVEDEWEVATKLESGLSSDMNTVFKLVSISDSFYTLKGNSKIQTADKDAYIEANGMKMRYDLTGNMTSDIKVDKNTGWIIDAKFSQKISGEAHVKENPQLPEGLTIPMTVSNEMTYADK